MTELTDKPGAAEAQGVFSCHPADKERSLERICRDIAIRFAESLTPPMRVDTLFS